MSSKTKYIVGTQPYVGWAMSAWQEACPDIECVTIELTQDTSYQFDFSQLADLTKENCTAFVAQDDQFLNFRRHELMAELKSRGFSMPPLIENGAIVASSARISENAWIGTGAIVGQDCQVGFNTVIGPGANLGNGAKIGNSAWIEAGVHIGRKASVGSNSTLGQGVSVADDIEIEKLVVIDKPGKILSQVRTKTFIHPGFDEPIVTVEPQSI